jgi:2-methylisocitrate lyase-like PEP mutase family enzyme
MPKKCGHTLGRRVIPIEDMVAKVKVAVASRQSADTLIIARTDSRTTLGLDEALRRGEAYARAGADILFIESPESVEELETVGNRLAGSAKLLANMVQGGRTPEVPADQLQAFGFSIAIYPGLAMRAAVAAVDQTYRHLQSARTATGAPVPLYESMHELMGFPDVWAFEERWQRDAAAE